MPEGFHFCGACGGTLGRNCAGCGSWMPQRYAFCGLCGAALSSVIPFSLPPATPRSTAPPEVPSEQRRRVAILFADLSGSTDLSHQLEAEETYRIVGECVSGLGNVIHEAGGYVVKSLGDGLMALFGAPVAHEDDPARAARAALSLRKWMQSYADEIQTQHGVRLRLRVGINYGSVVAAPIATGDRQAYDVLGDAVNVAQRLEAAAEPDTVCVSEAFYRITRAEFEYRDRGVARVKGKPEPLPLFELVRERSAGVAHSPEAFPLVGRERELSALRAAADGLSQGRSGILTLTGAGGLGKSRLLDELAGELTALGVPVLRASAAEGWRQSPFFLWRHWLLELLPFKAQTEHSAAVAVVRDALGPAGQTWAEWLTALALDPERLNGLEPEARSAVARGAIRAFLVHWRGNRPAAFLVDEIGSVDTLSLELLVEAAQESRDGGASLVALAGRELPTQPLGEGVVLQLGALEPAALQEWIERALPHRAVSEELLSRVVECSGGSPLFVDLMLRSASQAPNPLAVLEQVPDTLYGLVQAQVDALPHSERETAQVAAVLGKQFAERWLGDFTPTSVAGSEGAAVPLRTALSALEARDLLQEQSPPPERELAFRHGAVQEVLYEGMLTPHRRAEHARAARSIEVEAAHRPDLAIVVAGHWEAASQWRPALRWLLEAAEHASTLYLVEEAEGIYGRAARAASEAGDPLAGAMVQAGLAGLAAHRGEFEAALGGFAAAEEALRAGNSDRLTLARILREHARLLGLTGAPAEAEPLLDEVLGLLEHDPRPAALRQYARLLTERAQVHCDRGQPEAGVELAQRALTLAETQDWPVEGSAAGSALGRAYWLRGEWSAAEPVTRAAATRAESWGDWQGAAAGWITLANGLQSVGHWSDAEAAFGRALELAERIGDAEKCAIVRMDLGTLALNRGHWSDAEMEFTDAIERFTQMGHPLGVTASLYNLAETRHWSGHPEAEATLEAAEQRLLEVELPHLQVHAISLRGFLALARQEFGLAQTVARQALALAEEIDYTTGAALGRLALGMALHALGGCEESEVALRASLAEFEAAEARLEAARARAALAAVLTARGNAAEAVSLREEAEAAIQALDAAPWLLVLGGSGATIKRQ